MANYRVTDAELTTIASAIRTKGGTSASLVFPSGFVSAIQDISGGGSAVLGSKSITANGTYNASSDSLDGYSQVVVDVPQEGITPSGSISISANGTYDVSSYANAVVNVPQSGGGGNLTAVLEGTLSSIYDASASFVRSYCFASQNSLEYVNLPSCKSIGKSAFPACLSLSTVSFPACETVDANAFASTALEEIDLPLCTDIGTGAFYACISLSSVSLPNCETILSGAFSRCSELKEITLPKCETIGSNAFVACSTLSVVVLLSTSVTKLANQTAFQSTPMSRSQYLGHFGSIYVPSSLVDSYKAASYWSVYSDRITAYEGA